MCEDWVSRVRDFETAHSPACSQATLDSASGHKREGTLAAKSIVTPALHCFDAQASIASAVHSQILHQCQSLQNNIRNHRAVKS